MGARLVPALRSWLSEDELRQIGAFLSTPAGSAYSDRALYLVPRGPVAEPDIAAVRRLSNTSGAMKLADPTRIAGFSEALISASTERLTACKARQETVRSAKKGDEQILVSPGELRCSIPRPTYPTKARREGRFGDVVIRLWVNEAGFTYLTLVEKSSGVQSLDEAAEESVRAMRCLPYIENGKPFTVTARQPVSFRLE